jgi:hypothetical protein
VQELGRVQPEFLDDWRNMYAAWDHDPARRILQIHCVEWPGLSDPAAGQIKQRGVQA